MPKKRPTPTEQIAILKAALVCSTDADLAAALSIPAAEISMWKKTGKLPMRFSQMVSDPTGVGYSRALADAFVAISIAAHLAPDLPRVLFLHDVGEALREESRGRPWRLDDLMAKERKREGGDIDPRVWALFKADYLRPQMPTHASCWRRAKGLAKGYGVNIPGQATFRRRLEQEVVGVWPRPRNGVSRVPKL